MSKIRNRATGEILTLYVAKDVKSDGKKYRLIAAHPNYVKMESDVAITFAKYIKRGVEFKIEESNLPDKL